MGRARLTSRSQRRLSPAGLRATLRYCYVLPCCCPLYLHGLSLSLLSLPPQPAPPHRARLAASASAAVGAIEPWSHPPPSPSTSLLYPYPYPYPCPCPCPCPCPAPRNHLYHTHTHARRIYEDELLSAIESRSESLQTLRELGPPDLVHLIKQPIKSTTKQVGVYHHVSGIDASSSASLAAYINTLTYSPHDKQHKVVSGLYWYARP